MTNIYNKLEIPEPSANLESKIIASVNRGQKSYLFPRIGVIAVCLIISFMVLKPKTYNQIPQEEFLSDIQFFDDQYGFYEDIS